MSLANLVISSNTDVLTLTETCLGPCTHAQSLSELIPLGCDIPQVVQPDKRGGSAAILFKEGLGVKLIYSTMYLRIMSTWTVR